MESTLHIFKVTPDGPLTQMCTMKCPRCGTTAPRRTVIVPVKSRMCAQDLKTAPNEQRQEKKIKEVRRPEPQWIVKRHYSLHS